jgi:hypothetical protein
MIDFKEEISRYKPVLGLDDVERTVKSDDMKDVLDLLQYISKKIDVGDKEPEL